MNTEISNTQTDQYETMDELMSELMDRSIMGDTDGLAEAVEAARLVIDTMPCLLGGNLHDKLCYDWIAQLDYIYDTI